MIRNLPVSAVILMAITMITGCNDYGTDSESTELQTPPVLAESKVLNPANQNNRNFRAHLDGDAENPAVETQAQGQTKIQLTKDGTSIHFKLIAANIENITQPHIHCGAADVNGPVVVFLYPDAPPAELIPGRFSRVLAQGERSAEDVRIQPNSEAYPGGITDFDELVEKISSGEVYVNVHTTQNPAEEIRRQIQ